MVEDRGGEGWFVCWFCLLEDDEVYCVKEVVGFFCELFVEGCFGFLAEGVDIAVYYTF